jgi:hypothetical protein
MKFETAASKPGQVWPRRTLTRRASFGVALFWNLPLPGGGQKCATSKLTLRVSMAREPREREALCELALRQKQPDDHIRLPLWYFHLTME